MKVLRVVIDTNVFVSALRSRRGASFRLLSLLGDERFTVCISVPLVLEYEEVTGRQAQELGVDKQDIDDILDYVCSVADRRKIFYLWRPYLRDPRDDLVLEVAVEAGCHFIITYNERHFAGIKQFDLETLTPKQFLQRIGEIL